MESPAEVQAGTGPAPGYRVGRRVLTISADMGGGHNSTAAALEEALEVAWPGSEFLRVDTLDVLGPGIGRLFRGIYVTNVERTPWLYEFFYASLWRHRWFANASKRFTGSWCGRRLAAEIDRFDPDLILSTYPLGSAGVAWLRRHRGLAVPAAAWVSDFAPHPFWVYGELDATFVMDETAVPIAKAADRNPKVEVCAPPVVSAFSPGDRAEAKLAAGLRPDAFAVLVSCGAYAFGDVAGTVRTLLGASDRVQVLAACGRNDVTRRRLEQLGMSADRLLVLGWTDEMATLVRAADVVVTNAGGATALEALASGTPVLMYRPIAAHGSANANLMVLGGLADLCVTEQQLGHHIRAAIRDRTSLDGLRLGRSHQPKAADLVGGLRRLVEAGSRAESPAPRPWRMRPADAFFTHVETAAQRQELGAVLQLGPVAPGRSLTLDELRADLQRRSPGLSPMRRRLVRRPRPGWLLRHEIDVADHIHEQLVAPDAVDRDVFDLVSEFWSTPMPAQLPTWQMLLVHGQADGRAVMAVKLHHSQGDGISALGLLDRLLTPSGTDPLRSRLRGRRRLGGRPGSADGRLRRTLRDSGLVVRGVASLATRRPTPRHPLNRPVTSLRRQLVFVPMPAADLRSLARTLHAHSHELALSIVMDALSGLLPSRALVDPSRPLRVMVPVAMRAPTLDRIFANWTGSVSLDLSVAPADPRSRLAAVRDELRRRARRGEPYGAQAVMGLAGRLPTALHRRFARAVYHRRFFNTIVSYMPGDREPRWLGTAPVLATYPVLPLAPQVPLTVGIVVAGSTAGFGVTLDPALGLGSRETAAALESAIERTRRAADGPTPPAHASGD
ncbi:MAG TPA: wax ester/triacylglycerol synthase domain-containing protein [Nocardioidaceae bacterium]|nr:wax ester/triacylglycerol synthase domain-containing protein [Nocardioidaceae bacterium]